MTPEKQIRAFVMDNFLFTDDDSELISSESFMEKGILDSTGILEVIQYIEEEFGIKVEDEEMIPENLDSVDNIVAYIKKKKN